VVLVTTPEIPAACRWAIGASACASAVASAPALAHAQVAKPQGGGGWGPLKSGCWLRSLRANFTWPSGKRSAGIVSGLLQLQVFM